MTDQPLSPAADAVLDAYMNNCGWLDGPLEKDYRCAAAVLRAAVDQCKIEWNYHPDYPETESVIIVSDLLDIAAELDGTPKQS
jgi:hypothetical protein